MNKNTNFKVKNLNGTSDPRYALSNSKTGSSWLAIWRSEASSDRSTCCKIGCSNDAEVGAHVIVCDGRTDNTWYLVPFCKKCNNTNNTSEMFIDSRVTLVPVRRDMR